MIMRRIYLLFVFVLFASWVAQAQVEVPKKLWKIAASSEETSGEGSNGRAVQAIDDDTLTYWHSNWSSGTETMPQYLLVDMGKAYDLLGFTYKPRPNDGSVNTWNGTIHEWEFAVSADSVTWDVVGGGDWNGTYEWGTQTKTEMLDPEAMKGIRYIKLTALSGQADVASCSEFGALASFVGANFDAAPTTVYIGKTVQFTDKSDNNPTAWSWTFDGGTPATSTEQNPVVTYEKEGVYDVKLEVTYSDGTTSSVTFPELITVNKRIPKGAFKVVYYDSEETVGEGSNGFAWEAIDDDVNTYWHTSWTVDPNPPYPHTLAVDMGEEYTIEAFVYYPRYGNGTVDSCDFYVLKEWPDREDTSFWEDPVNWGEPAVSGAKLDYTDYDGNGIRVDLKGMYTGRYFVFYALHEWHGNAWANAREIYIVGEPAAPTRISKNQLDVDVNIYPNPAHGTFMIKLNEDNANIRIYNTAGMLIYQKNGASATESVNVDGKGVYLINIEIDGKTTTRKLIIR